MFSSSSTQRETSGEFTFGGPASAGALNTGEPIEEPETDGTSDVKNHLSDLDLDFTIGSSCRGHHVSFWW
jgi:hypothetical protein